MISKSRWIKLPEIRDERGVLTPCEEHIDLGFKTNRLFLLTARNLEDLPRLKSKTDLVLILVEGSLNNFNFRNSFQILKISVSEFRTLSFSDDFIAILVWQDANLIPQDFSILRKDPNKFFSANHLAVRVPRFFFLSQVPGDKMRGGHAHKTGHQVIVVLKGSITLQKTQIGKKVTEIEMDSKSNGNYVEPKTWIELANFSNDAIVLVLCSESFNELGYTRDYNEFVKYQE